MKNVKVGDEVIVHSGWWRPDDPWVLSGKDPMLAESTRIWGYQTNYGSYCQFARAQAHQCIPKPKRLTWEAAGCFLLCASTAYRMLMGWAPHTVERGDVVLVWGATGGLGSMALEITRAQGGRAVAVVSDEAKRKFCVEHGAAGVINRTQFDHWGPHARHEGRQGLRRRGPRAPAPSARPSGTRSARRRARASSSSTRARRRCRRRSSSAPRAA